MQKNAKPVIDERKTGLLRAYLPNYWRETDSIIKQGLKNTHWDSNLIKSIVDSVKSAIERRKNSKSAQSDEKD